MMQGDSSHDGCAVVMIDALLYFLHSIVPY